MASLQTLSCGICKKDARTPRLLPCLHWFCETCITARAKMHKTCPSCETSFYMADEGAKRFPHRRPVHCDSHPHEALKTFCRDCNQLICKTCIMSSHRGHLVGNVEDHVSLQQSRLQSALDSTKGYEDMLQAIVSQLDEARRGFEKTIKSTESQVHSAFVELAQRLEERQQELTKELRELSVSRSNHLESQQEVLKRNLSTVLRVRHFTAEILLSKDTQHIMALGRHVETELDKLSPSAWPLHPTAGSDIAFLPSTDDLVAAIRDAGQVVETACRPSDCVLKCAPDGTKSYKVTVTARDMAGALCSDIEFKATVNTTLGEDQPLSLIESSDGVYTASFPWSPELREARIAVTMHGQHIKSSPSYLIHELETETLVSELQQITFYPFNKCKDVVVRSFRHVTYSRAAAMLCSTENAQARAVGLWATGRCLQPDESATLPDGRVLNNRELSIEAISVCPSFSMAYTTLGGMLTGGQTIALSNGSQLDSRQLYLQAIKQDPHNSIAYLNLSQSINGDETVTLHDNRMATKRQLLLEAIRYDSSNAVAYASLACLMKNHDTVTMHSGRVMDCHQLSVEALRVDPRNSTAYATLAGSLEDYENAKLSDGRALNKRQLFVEAIRCDNSNAHAYINLGWTLREGETVTLADGRVMSKPQLYQEALKCSPSSSYALNNLGLLVKLNGMISTPDGRSLTKQQLFLEAIHGDPHNAMPYNNLAVSLGDHEQVTLLDGRVMDKKQLLVEALRFDASLSKAYTNLGTCLKPGERIKLADGRTVDKKQLYLDAINADPQQTRAYQNLAKILDPTDTVTLHDGRLATKTELCYEALSTQCTQCGGKLSASAARVYGESLLRSIEAGKTNELSANPSEEESLTVTCYPYCEKCLCRECALLMHRYPEAVFPANLIEEQSARLRGILENTHGYDIVLQEAIEGVEEHHKILADNASAAGGQLVATFTGLLEAVRQREQELKKQLRQSSAERQKKLETQQRALMGASIALRHAREFAALVLDSNDPIEVAALTGLIVHRLESFSPATWKSHAAATVEVLFMGVAESITRTIRKTGRLVDRDCIAADCRLICTHKSANLRSFIIMAKNKAGNPTRHQQFQGALTGVSASQQFDVQDLGDGFYSCHVFLRKELSWQVAVKLNEAHITGSPITLSKEINIAGLQKELLNVRKYRPKERNMSVGGTDMTYEAAAMALITKGNTVQQSVGLWAAARCLNAHETVRLPQGQVMNKQELLIEAIRVDVSNTNAYIQLSGTLKEKETVTLHNGKVFDRKQLLVEALRLDSSNARAYNSLGLLLRDKEGIALADGRKLNKRELFLQAIRCDATFAFAYNNLSCLLANDENILLLDGRLMTKSELVVESLQFDSNNAKAYANLGLLLRDKETIDIDGLGTFTNVQLFLEALKHDQNLAEAYNNLGLHAQSQMNVLLPDGRSMTKRQLYLEAIRCDPKHASAYNNLALLLKDAEVVTLADGRKMTSRALYLEAIQQRPSFAAAYCNLGALLKTGQAITLQDGRTMDKRKLYLEAVRLDPYSANAYNNLGLSLSASETVVLPDRRSLTSRELFWQALNLEPQHSSSLTNLALTLRGGETINLGDGRNLNKRDLLLEAIRCGPYNSLAYSNLGSTLQDKEMVQLLDGRRMGKRELFLEALSHDPQNSRAYTNLGLILADDEAIQLLDGRTFTKRQLHIEAIRWDPRNAFAYSNLAVAIQNPHEVVTLLDGRRMRKQELFKEATRNDPDMALPAWSLIASGDI